MSGAIQQERAPSSPPGGQPAPGPSTAARQGHYAMVARMVGDFERAAERITDLDEIPLPLLARFARALNLAELNTLARVHPLEEEASD